VEFIVEQTYFLVNLI